VSYVGNPKLMNNIMAKISILIPYSIDEQTKIANFLNDIDNKINHVTKQLEGTKQFKK
jgi:type I restriction enzyme S subunit